MTAAAGAAKASQALVGEASTGWPVAAALSLVLADHITARSRAAGRPLADIALPPGTVVASLVRDGTPTVPDGQCLLRPGDELLVVSGKASERDVHAAFQ